ncbi:MAG: methionine--tRNA ligase [Candidatus Heimdallarchaeota archaeon]|nr:methionine--tRNA ligase [Candidatus Heimdallarchaeota archaeon]MCK4769163.1 methionine--tRNA ligase [Candidatus Heimdallarchaeota archaeon]
MSEEKWVITAAWPYVNNIPHLGTFSQLLWGDVITRYHKLRKHETLYVSGSDAHGTPIVVAAEAEGVSPIELAMRYHNRTLELLDEWNIVFDKYTTTHNPLHISFVQEFHKKIHKNGYFNLKETEQYYCVHDQRFLPDRFVEGICPICGVEGARGDQCNNPECESILKPTDLIEPHCITCHKTPVLKKTSHWYFDLPAFSDALKKFADENSHIPPFAKQKLLSMIEEGLIERPISRDMTWGIPIDPIFGEEFVNKVLYVWFENVLGYISTVKFIAEEQGKPKLFDEFWLDKNTKTVFCIGKDNIIFHALIFPAMLLATGDPYPLPYAVATTNFIQFKEGPFSKSKGIGIWCDEATATLPADYWRYYLSNNRAELKDSYFDWDEFASNVNVDLNDVTGNFIHRTLTFIGQHFQSKIPERGKLTEEENGILTQVEKNIALYLDAMDNFKLKDATKIAISVARLGNQYFSSVEPWHLIKKDKKKTATVLNLSAKISEVISVLLWPIIPGTAEKIWGALGFQGKPVDKGIDAIDVNETHVGQEIKKIKPVFHKVKADEIQKKLKEVRKKNKGQEKKGEDEMERINYEVFKKVNLKIATIKSATIIEKSKNLIKLQIDLGTEERQILAGIKQYYKPEDLVGRQIVVVTNLQPATLMGEKSDGMLLAADIDGEPILLNLDKPVPPGTEIK